MEGEGDVLHHDEHVRHRDPRQKHVDWIHPEIEMFQVYFQFTTFHLDLNFNAFDIILQA